MGKIKAKFHSCFVGIKLPEVFRREYDGLLAFLKLQNIGLKTVDTNRVPPHITVYFIGDQFEQNLPLVIKKSQEALTGAQDIGLIISGGDKFGGNRPKVLFLKVLYPPKLRKIYYRLKSALEPLEKIRSNSNFLPHVTLARLPYKKNRREFKTKDQVIKNRLDAVYWQFNVDELVLFGVDIDTDPSKHIEIAKFPL